MDHNELSRIIVDTAIKVHSSLGPGLLESVYLHVLAHELRKRNLLVQTEVPVPVVWESLKLDIGCRADLVVEDLIIVELKSVESIAAIHRKQLLTYLRLTNKQLGLLLNFGAELMKDGIFRVVNGLKE